MKRLLLIMSLTIIILVIFGSSISVLAADSGLVQLLSSNLGVTKKQASGGAGSIFKVAKQNLSAGDFAKVAKAVPGINNMITAAPKSEGVAGVVGGTSSLMGNSATSVNKVASLTDSFSKLGMKAGMVNEFTPIILNYVKKKGGEPVMKILQSALQ